MAISQKELYDTLVDGIRRHNTKLIDAALNLYTYLQYDLNYTPSIIGSTLLHIALENNDWDTTKKLIEAGVDINNSNTLLSPFVVAVQSNNPELIIKLFDLGVDINSKGSRNALSSAIGNLSRAVYDKNEQAKSDALVIIDLLLKNGASAKKLVDYEIHSLFDNYPEAFYALLNSNKFDMNTYINAAYLHKDLPIDRYKQSGRPKASMKFAKSNCPPGSYLPVVRYEKLYYNIDEESDEAIAEKGYCGTFYYYEPDSPLFLNVGNILVTSNKIDAYRKLTGLTFEELISREREEARQFWDESDNSNYLAFADNPKRLVTEIIPNESSIFPIYADANTKRNALLIEKSSLTGENEYIGSVVVDEFDYIDQTICKLARDRGYDTVLLQREPGETRMVSEILDVRSREISYQSFCLIDSDKYSMMANKSTYPTVWFSEYGFIKR